MFLLPNLLTKVYKGILLPTFMRAQLQKLICLDKGILKLTSHGQTPAENKIKIHAVVLVKKCLYSEWACEISDNFFEIRVHEKASCNNDFLLQVPKDCLQLTASCFCSMGVKFYSSCPWNNVRLNIQNTSRVGKRLSWSVNKL